MIKNLRTKFNLLPGILFFILNYSLSAQDLFSVNAERHNLEREGMISLTAWASINITGGTAGYFLSKNPEWKYFHEMNVFWNTVNLGLGIAALARLPKEKPDLSWGLEKSRKSQRKLEKIFLINTGLDLVYIGAGLSMSLLADGIKNRDRMKGYGNALLLQGTYLFLFDGIEFFLHRNNGWRLFEKTEISVRPSGLGLGLYLGLR